MEIDSKKSLFILSHVKGFGRTKILKLLKHFGSAEESLKVGWDQVNNIFFKKWHMGDWEKDLEALEKEGAHLVSFQESHYPQFLLTISDFPLLLYVKGSLSLEEISPSPRTVALVGTRNSTLYGKEKAREIALTCAKRGLTIVSGLARGIDTAAHVGALEGKGRTLAVIGSGLNALYPRENLALSEKIASQGALISEFPMDAPPFKGNFPKRNRIVSGLSQAVALIESSQEGGGMLTLQLAEQQKRACFALPGRVDWPSFAGNHRLLKEKKAQFLENGEDLLHYLDCNVLQPSKTETPHLSAEEQAFLDKLPCEEKSIDALVWLTQLPIMKLNVLLMRLVLKKAVKEYPGKLYKKI